MNIKRLRKVLWIPLILFGFLAYGGTGWYVTIRNTTPDTLRITPAGDHNWNLGDFGRNQSVPAFSSSRFYTEDKASRDGIVGINIYANNRYLSHVEFVKDHGHQAWNNWKGYGERAAGSTRKEIQVERITNSNSSMHVSLRTEKNLLPVRFISIGLGEMSVLACNQVAIKYSQSGYYENSCGDNNVDMRVSFQGGAEICRFQLNDMGQPLGDINCGGSNVVATYVQASRAIFFLCQSTGGMSSFCPWVSLDDPTQAGQSIF